jgi:F-type H+-transporting ATPase subunit a
MSEVVENVASEATEGGHEITLFAEPIGTIGGWMPVTNSLLTSWLSVVVIIFLAVLVRARISKTPRGLQNYFEAFWEGALSIADSITTSREKSVKFLPLAASLFLFIMINNWLGLLPGIGTIGYGASGESVPLLRGATADLNTTIALSLITIVITHIVGVTMITAKQHVEKFLPFRTLFAMPMQVIKHKDFTALLISPIKFFVGILEIVGELAKVMSLSFRLFGNIFAGEVLLSSMMMLFAYVLPVPFMFLEVMVGVIQAFIFAMLTLVFLTMMSTSHEEGHEGAH